MKTSQSFGVHFEKKDTPVTTPLLSKAIEILKKYKHNLRAAVTDTVFFAISNQKVNAYLKDVAIGKDDQRRPGRAKKEAGVRLFMPTVLSNQDIVSPVTSGQLCAESIYILLKFSVYIFTCDDSCKIEYQSRRNVAFLVPLQKPFDLDTRDQFIKLTDIILEI
ncbi:MAG: hypothetical protein ACTHZ1_04075 [Sphingobacterium sp.]